MSLAALDPLITKFFEFNVPILVSPTSKSKVTFTPDVGLTKLKPTLSAASLDALNELPVHV